MQFMMGFSIGCIFIGLIMFKFSAKFAAGIVANLNVKTIEAVEKLKEEIRNECKDNR